jgi:hypothetical protein
MKHSTLPFLVDVPKSKPFMQFAKCPDFVTVKMTHFSKATAENQLSPRHTCETKPYIDFLCQYIIIHLFSNSYA